MAGHWNGEEMVELARIKKVDLREVWSNEAADFTPWLQKNIGQLSDALGMDLEVDEREAPVGTFSLDLLARDGSGRPVIIENQLGTTDHTHLGPLVSHSLRPRPARVAAGRGLVANGW